MAVESGFLNRYSDEVVPIGKTVDMEFEEAQQRLRTDLLQHLGNLVDQADYSDLEFLCSDEVRVKATKALLRGRSPVLDRMLTNGMLETFQSVIRLPEISSLVVLYLLDILYAGASVHHPLVDWTMAFEAISAAHFFLLPNVIKIVRKFLCGEVEQVAEDKNFSELASMLTAAMEVKCIVHDEDDIVLEMVRLLNYRWTQFECAVNLSEEAVHIILRKTKPDLEETEFSLAEYFRIREMVLWSVFQVILDSESATDAKRIVDCSMPLKKEDLYKMGDVITLKRKIVWLPNRDKFDLTGGKLRQFLSRECCKDTMARLLKNIDCLSIPEALLVQIIGPLQILPSSQPMEVLESNALWRPVKFYCKWVHDSSYATEKRGFVIHKSGNRHCWAICQPVARVSRWSGVTLQWRFCLDKIGSQSIELGLARITPRHLSEYAKNMARPTNCILYRDMMALRVMRLESGKVVSISPHNRKDRHVDLPSSIAVLITFDQRTRLCTASVDGHEEIASRRWISCEEDVSPAVNLGSLPGARVRIEIVSGFELL